MLQTGDYRNNGSTGSFHTSDPASGHVAVYESSLNTVGMDIKRSFNQKNYRYAVPAGGIRRIAYGDCMYVRFILKGQIICEFGTTTANDMTELIGELRRRARDTRGLGKVIIRNASRGWCYEAPLMLYGMLNPSVRQKSIMARQAIATPRISQAYASEKRMYKPWETH